MSQCSVSLNTKRCLVYDIALKFSKCGAALLALIAFLSQTHLLVLVTSFLMFSGGFSTKSNILYQFYTLVFKKLLKDKSKPTQKGTAELRFISVMGGTLFFIGFLLLYFGKFINFAWILILTTSLFMFLGCLTGFCLAASMYVFFKKILKSKK